MRSWRSGTNGTPAHEPGSERRGGGQERQFWAEPSNIRYTRPSTACPEASRWLRVGS